MNYFEKSEEHLAKKYSTSVKVKQIWFKNIKSIKYLFFFKTVAMLLESAKVNDETKLLNEKNQNEIKELNNENLKLKQELKIFK